MSEYKKNLEKLIEMVHNVEGDIVELGVYKGDNSVIFGHAIKNTKKRYFGFDTFSGYTQEDIDTSPNKEGLIRNQETGRWNISPQLVVDRLKEENIKEYCFLVTGDIKTTVPFLVKKKVFTKVSLLYVDCNAYLPSRIGIENIFPLMDEGSIVVIDEHKVGGETKALKEFCKQQNLQIIETGNKFPNGPPMYTVIRR